VKNNSTTKPVIGAINTVIRFSIIPFFMAGYAELIHLLVPWALAIGMDPFGWQLWAVGAGVPFLLAVLILKLLKWI